MKFYQWMSRWPFPRTYAGKIILVCFLGVQMPAIALIGYLLTAGSATPLPVGVLMAVLVLSTLLSTVCTIAAVHGLLAPLRLTGRMLMKYTDEGILPELPTEYRDEAGQLMNRVRSTIQALDIAQRELRRLASIDPLTGLGNRRWLLQRGQDEVVRARRDGAPLSLVVMDLDHFKQVNDRFGHMAGDAALIAASEIVRSCVRPYDLVARLGGEEFCFLLPGADMPTAVEIAERIRQQISHAEIEGLGDARVTGSFGVCTLKDTDAGLVAMIARADTVLYRAKGFGRNRVVTAT